MKKLLVMLICLALSLSLMACDFIPLDDALDFVEDLFKGGSSSESLLYEFDDSSKTFTVTGIGTCTNAHLVIPDTHNGYPVVAIGERAFAGCSSLTIVIFEDPTGWWYADSADATSGTAISENRLTNVSTAASYLRNHYCYKYWFKH